MHDGSFKSYIGEDREYFIFRDAADLSSEVHRDFPLMESLVSFTELDFSTMEDRFMQIDMQLYRLQPGCGKGVEAKIFDKVSQQLFDLAEQHIVFEWLRLDYAERFEELRNAEEPDYRGVLFNTSMRFMLNRFTDIQEKLRWMLQDVFNAHPGEKIPYRSRIVAYKNANFFFPFSVLTTRLEMVSDHSFSEVLYARDTLDIIDFYLRECLIRQLTARRCKHCGRWFFLTGHLGLEYCERTDNGRGRTCREIGASALWVKSKNDDRVFMAYRREYKKRNAWMQTGKLEQGQYDAWCQQAKAMRDNCSAGKLSFEDYTAWLKKV